jgi:hypothetical protein
MKKVLLALTLCLGFAMANAQTPTVQMTGSDTVTTTGTVNLDLTLANDYNSVTLQFVTTKIGTVTVAGTTILQVSNDGVNYITLGNEDASFGDTATVTNVAAFTHMFGVTPARYKYYRLKTTGSGSGSYIVRAYAQPRKN